MRAGAWLALLGVAALLGAGGMATDHRLHVSLAPATATQVDLPATASAAPAAGGSASDPAPGVLGARVQDVPASWPVRGCEIASVDPGGTAAALGLVGATNRTDPVGDVISTIDDATITSTPVPIASCAALTAALKQMQGGDAITVGYYHRVAGVLGGRWVAATASGTLASSGTLACPAPITGTITRPSQGNRIQLQIELRGPAATAAHPAVLDTGADETIMPDADLRDLGFKPSSTTATAGLVPGTQTTAYVYRIPAADILVDDQGRFVPLAAGTVVVWGIPNESGIWLGPNVLERGLQLTTAGRHWTLNVPCASTSRPFPLS